MRQLTKLTKQNQNPVIGIQWVATIDLKSSRILAENDECIPVAHETRQITINNSKKLNNTNFAHEQEK